MQISALRNNVQPKNKENKKLAFAGGMTPMNSGPSKTSYSAPISGEIRPVRQPSKTYTLKQQICDLIANLVNFMDNLDNLD